MGQIAILNDKGHTAVEWDVEKPESVEKARMTYNEFLSQGFATFAVAAPGAPAEQIREFDPKAESIFAVKQFQGG